MHRIGAIVDARRCTVQTERGVLFLDSLATAATALIGHDPPPPASSRREVLARRLSRIDPDYRCVAVTHDFAAALARAEAIAGAAGGYWHLADAAAGAPDDVPRRLTIADESMSFARTGRWFASGRWSASPALIVVGDSLAAGSSIGAVFVHRRLPASARSRPSPATETAVERANGVLDLLMAQDLMAAGESAGRYLGERLASVRETCGQIVAIQASGLRATIRFVPTLPATKIKGALCQRGVLVGLDDQGRLVIEPPLVIRPAEIDVISGALRGALMGSAIMRTAPYCAACSDEMDGDGGVFVAT